MRLVRITLCLLLCGALVACEKPPAPAKPDNKDYMRGYSAGRRDERKAICDRFEQHKAGFQGALGSARMGLIHTFCAMQI